MEIYKYLLLLNYNYCCSYHKISHKNASNWKTQKQSGAIYRNLSYNKFPHSVLECLYQHILYLLIMKMLLYSQGFILKRPICFFSFVYISYEDNIICDVVFSWQIRGIIQSRMYTKEALKQKQM